MQLVQLVLFGFGIFALARGAQATRGSALFHAVLWGCAAWGLWSAAIFLRGARAHGIAEPAAALDDAITYLALCLTGCAGVAVLGARRPQVVAWNFVVLSLLAVMLLPFVENALIGASSLDSLRIAFLAITLGISLLNYLPTRFGAAALLVGLACAAELIALAAPTPLPRGAENDALALCLLAAPVLALFRWFPADQLNELDRTWREFRDRWGVVWAQRVREQFNRSAANAGWPVSLTWQGFASRGATEPSLEREMRATLAALLKRFDNSG
jgi:hypothetical protein